MAGCNNSTTGYLVISALEMEETGLAFIHLVLSAAALVVSLLNLAVLTRPRMLASSSINYLLAALETGNLVFAILNIPYFLIRFFKADFLGTRAYQMVFVVVMHSVWAAVLYVLWMTVVVGGWRYVLVAWPLKSKYWLTKSLALALTSSVVAFCVLMTVVQFLGFQFQFPIPNSPCTIVIWPELYEAIWGSFSKSIRRDLGRFYLALSFIIYLLPVLCFIVINALIIWKLCQVKDNRQSLQEGSVVSKDGFETRTTVVLIVLMWLFLVGSAPPCLSVAAQLFGIGNTVPLPWTEKMWEFLPSLVVGVLSFFGYYFMNNVYKEAFLDMLRRIRCGRPEPVSNQRDRLV